MSAGAVQTQGIAGQEERTSTLLQKSNLSEACRR